MPSISFYKTKDLKIVRHINGSEKYLLLTITERNGHETEVCIFADKPSDHDGAAIRNAQIEEAD